MTFSAFFCAHKLQLVAHHNRPVVIRSAMCSSNFILHQKKNAQKEMTQKEREKKSIKSSIKFQIRI